MIQVEIVTSPPESRTVARNDHLLPPRDAIKNGTILLKNEDDATDTFFLRLSEVTPTQSGAVLALRLGSFAEGIVRKMLATPKEVAERSVRDVCQRNSAVAMFAFCVARLNRLWQLGVPRSSRLLS